jgi:CRP-like cAMP-binding protein
VREEALKARETEYERVRKEAEEFPARLRAATEQAAGEAARAAEARLEQQLASLKKDAEIEKRLAEMQAQTLEGIISRQREQIEALQKQVDLAKQQVQDIAVKAIEGASGSKALSHVNQIAIEQAKNRPQS